jgi:hypothetical protein
MGKRKPPPRKWTLHLESVYRSDRDERIQRAFHLALPLSISNPPLKVAKETTDNESPHHRHLRARVQR